MGEDAWGGGGRVLAGRPFLFLVEVRKREQGSRQKWASANIRTTPTPL